MYMQMNARCALDHRRAVARSDIDRRVRNTAQHAAAPVFNQRHMIRNDITLSPTTVCGLLILRIIARAQFAKLPVANGLDRSRISHYQIAEQKVIENPIPTVRVHHIADSITLPVIGIDILVWMIQRYRFTMKRIDCLIPEYFVGITLDNNMTVAVAC